MTPLIRFVPIVAIATVLGLGACKQEQVLYETDQPSTEGAGAAQPIGTTTQIQFERPPDRDMLPLDELKLHNVAGVEVVMPRDWTFARPDTPMRAAEITTNGVNIVIFHFGPGQGGSAEMNISRWLGQIQLASGWEPTLYQHRTNGLVISEVIARGDYTPTGMGQAAPPPETIPDAVLHGVVVEDGPQGSLFIRATGTARAIDRARPGLETMVQLLRPVASE